MPMVSAPRFFAFAQAGERKGRGAAGGDPEQHILGSDLVKADQPKRVLDLVFGAFHRAGHGVVAARHKERSRSSGQQKVGISSAPSCTASRPEVPAPT